MQKMSLKRVWLTDKYKKIESSIANQDIESVKTIVQNCINLCDLTNAIGETVLHLAVNHRCIDLIHWLLQKYIIDVDSIDFTKKTALHLAASLKFDDVVECLLNYNAKIDVKDSYGDSPFHLAITGGSISLIQIFLNHGADVMDFTSKNLQTSFHLALLDENYEVFEFLLKKYEGSLDAANAYGETLLHVLARKKNKHLVKLLLERGIDFEKVNQDQSTALHIATQERNHEVVKLLLQHGANANVKNKYNESPLHIAIRNKDVELVDLLLLNGADATAESHNRNSPLHLAVNYYDAEILEKLVKLKINVDAKNADNLTPFHLAVAVRNRGALRTLLKKGASVNSESSKIWISYQQFKGADYKEYKYLSPLHTAIILKDVQAVQVLLRKSVKLDLENQFEIFLAIDVGSPEILAHLLNCSTNCYRYYPVKLNIVNKEGESLIYRALRHFNVELIQTLLKNGATVEDVLLAAKSKEPILHLAVKSRQPKFVQFLLNLGVDINFLDSKQHTALWYAKERNISIAEILIRHIALIKVKNGRINEQNLNILNSVYHCGYYYEVCLNELNKLKEAKCCGVSLLLFLTKNVISLPKLLGDQDLRTVFTDTVYSVNYPIYFEILEGKMEKAVERWKLIIKAKEILNSIGCFDTLYDIIDNILDHFSNNELKDFILRRNFSIHYSNWMYK